MKTTLFYIHDPMCSWCYAFKHTLAELKQQLPDTVQWCNVLGGLAKDSMDIMPLTTQQMIQNSWHRIEQNVATVSFNFDFWKQNKPIRSTYPACRAVLAAKKQGKANEMVVQIQTVYYQQAKNPALHATLLDCANEIKLDTTQFKTDYYSDAIEQLLQQEIQTAQNLRVDAYPSLRLKIDDDIWTIAINYNDVAVMKQEITVLMEIHRE